MAKYEVQKGRSLPSKIGLIRGGGVIERKNMLQSDDELALLIKRKIIKEHKANPVAEVVKRALNLDEKKRDKQLQDLDAEIEEKRSVLFGLESSVKEQQSILDSLKLAIEEQGAELEKVQKLFSEADAALVAKNQQLASTETEDVPEKEASEDEASNKTKGPARPTGVKK